MRLFFLRHAHALEGADDAARPLSPKGLKQCRAVGKFLKRAGVQFDRVYSSPLVRARQTADAVLAAMESSRDVKVEEADALLNDDRGFERWLLGLPKVETVLLVGHAPSLSVRLAGMLGLDDPDAVDLPKAGLACLETPDRLSGSLKLFASPKLGLE